MLSRVLLSLLAVGASVARAASTGCPVFDADMNLYVLGGPSDYVLGAQSGWSSASAKTLSASGKRPPFTGAKAPRCYLSQYNNAIYVLGADAAHPTSIYILNVAAKSWSLQTVNAAGIDSADQVEILDHDTNVFYALSKGGFWFLNLNDQKQAVSSALTWTNMDTKPAFATSGYKPTLGLATNHIHMFGTPGSSPGQASIFVIHFAYPQPKRQLYPSVGGKTNFPVAHGQAPSFFRDGPAQRVISFIPDDSSATYLVDTKANTTLVLAGPSDKSAGSIFAASMSAVVQLTPAGRLFFLPVDQNDISGTGANAHTAWKTLAALPGSTPAATPSPSPSGTSKGATPTGKPSSSTGSSSSAASGGGGSGSEFASSGDEPESETDADAPAEGGARHLSLGALARLALAAPALLALL